MFMLMFYAKKNIKALNIFINLETKRTVDCLNMPLPRATTFLWPKMDGNAVLIEKQNGNKVVLIVKCAFLFNVWVVYT